MKISKFLAGFAAVAATSASMAGTVFSEGFEDTNTLAGKGWAIQNLSSPVDVLSSTSWFQGNPLAPGAFPAAQGPINSYVAANFLGAKDGGTIDNWLMTPVVPMNSTITMNYALRLLGDGFLDTVQVLYSISGASTNVADFLPLNTYSSTSDTGWLDTIESLSFLNTSGTGRFAFRYMVANTTTAGNYVGIDTVAVVPEPTSLALVGLALAGAAASRRRKA